MITGTRYRLNQEIRRQQMVASDIAQAQAQISTGKRIQTPSDDSVASARVSVVARAQSNEAAWKRNLDTAAALSERSDTVLGSVANNLVRASELLVQAASDTLSAADRAPIILELRSIATEVNALSNSRDTSGNPLFRTGSELQIPVGDNVSLSAVGTRDAIFGSVPTAAGPQDLATLINAAADAVAEPVAATRATLIATSIDTMNGSTDHIAAARGDQGARGNRIDQLIDRSATIGIQLKAERSALEDTDITEVVAKLQSSQLTLEAAQAAFARTNQSTLFDLLR